jgi:hypothetical protein
MVSTTCIQSALSDVIVKEASGITKLGNDLLIVSDDDAGAYYTYSLDAPAVPDKGLITISGEPPKILKRVELLCGQLALDLESIDVLADGRIVVLSERSHSLITEDGIVADYSDPLSDFGNRGLEGLAVRSLEDGSSRIAVLWEGGYPEYKDVPVSMRKELKRFAIKPFIWIHDLKPGADGIEIRMKYKDKYSLKEVILNVPEPEGEEPDAQRFRAPDLVWHKLKENEWGFIVLLNSQNSPESGKTEYKHIWLQRFTADGQPYGSAYDLKQVALKDLPKKIINANWEGLGWFEEGKRLVLIHDKPPKGNPTAVVINLPEDWKIREVKPAAEFTHLIEQGELHGVRLDY